MFDFSLFKIDEFDGWGPGKEAVVIESDELFYRQKIWPEHAGYARGVQILRPERSKRQIFASIKGEDTDRDERWVKYRALDWRNEKISEISTAPYATTNYFQSHSNDLPFETSPAFFNPEVLTRYKSNREKYTVNDYSIRCRNIWLLRYGVNDCDQVHAYIVDLRNLPYSEMLYWKSFNVQPKTGLSESVIQTDFLAEWPKDIQPLAGVLDRLRGWKSANAPWWSTTDESILDNVSTPRSASRQEWGEGFLSLSKLIIEGFSVKYFRLILDKLGVDYKSEEKSLVLAEKILKYHTLIPEESRLSGLREVQLIRSKVIAHSGSSQVQELSRRALETYETYPRHFEYVCRKVSDELELIEQACSI